MIFLIFMELLSWLFVFSLESHLCMKYLFIQSYFVIMMLAFIFWAPSLIMMSMLLKIGLPPFQGWLLHFASLLPILGFFFLSTLHKLMPLVFLGKMMPNMPLGCILLVISSLLLWQSSLFFFMLVCSSMVHTMWMVLGFLVSKSFATMYWIVYSFVILVLLKSFSFRKVMMLTVSQGSLAMSSWLILSGIPPFSLFWLKANLFIALVGVSFFFSILIIFSSVLALSIYFWGFHLSVMSSYSYGETTAYFSPLIMSLFFVMVI